MARTPQRGETWSARQVYIAADSSRGQFEKAARVGHLNRERLGAHDVVVLRVAEALSHFTVPGMTRPRNEERPITGWEQAAVALVRETLKDQPASADLLLLVSKNGVSMASGRERAQAFRTLASADAPFMCLPVGAWSAAALSITPAP